MHIVPGDLSDPRIVALLDHHVATARAQTTPDSAHALDRDALRAPAITVLAAWDGDTLAGIGALAALSPDHGEVKSMHTALAMRGRGAATAMLRHIIALARARGHVRLSLETGSMPYFAPARALYRAHGFALCGPFADYRDDPNSVYMTLDLRDA